MAYIISHYHKPTSLPECNLLPDKTAKESPRESDFILDFFTRTDIVKFCWGVHYSLLC